MEEERKKKRNRKKKNKQSNKAATEDAPDQVAGNNQMTNGKHENEGVPDSVQSADQERDQISDDGAHAKNEQNDKAMTKDALDLLNDSCHMINGKHEHEGAPKSAQSADHERDKISDDCTDAKNKQNDKATVEDALDLLDNNSHMSNGKHKHEGMPDPVQGAGHERDEVSDDGADACSTAEGKKQSILQEKANLENSLKQLQYENDLISEKRLASELKIAELQSEKESWLIKEASLEKRIGQLSDDKACLALKQVNLEEMIEKLKGDKESWVLKENSSKEIITNMELDIRRLQIQVSELEELKTHSVQENLALKEQLSKLQTQMQELERNASIAHSLDEDIKATLEEKIRGLSDERTTLILKQGVLEEEIKQIEGDCQSWISKENSSKDVISNMGDELRKLQLQVVEIEELKNNAVQENQSFKGQISELQEQIKELEKNKSHTFSSNEQVKYAMENDDLNSQMEAACALVEKLITENAELVEKVNELYLELDKQKAEAGPSSPILPESAIQVGESISDRGSTSAKNIRLLDEERKSSEIMPTIDEMIIRNKEDINNAFPSISPNSSDTGEIVQIPLDENEAHITESQAVDIIESTSVPLSDAPLVGAPFRLISFVARYVSGADLVDEP